LTLMMLIAEKTTCDHPWFRRNRRGRLRRQVSYVREHGTGRPDINRQPTWGTRAHR
jgi:hypothetical protein